MPDPAFYVKYIIAGIAPDSAHAPDRPNRYPHPSPDRRAPRMGLQLLLGAVAVRAGGRAADRVARAHGGGADLDGFSSP
jgi:hypothetical protein